MILIEVPLAVYSTVQRIMTELEITTIAAHASPPRVPLAHSPSLSQSLLDSTGFSAHTKPRAALLASQPFILLISACQKLLRFTACRRCRVCISEGPRVYGAEFEKQDGLEQIQSDNRVKVVVEAEKG
ncbi:hypothetical protein ElyMa_001778900 [Elysia marginata]|uniref:Uncharacterized protein n=1 Tax=Elysia marginata TaxID=1093978 RepID=A0AAV4ECV8_9GAST|nr:hypothetical protein ElyMa_001778900 [Elysia marginata]